MFFWGERRASSGRHLTFANQLPHVRVVFGNRHDLILPDLVGAAVSDMADIGVVPDDECRRQRGARRLRPPSPDLPHPSVGLEDNRHDGRFDIGEIGKPAAPVLREDVVQEPYRRPAGEIAPNVPAHTVGYREERPNGEGILIGPFYRHRDIRVLVLFPDQAPVGGGKQRDGGVDRLSHE